ncbi:MAG: glycoside hydrolase domain-containing protein, partial [Bacteroidota bacterium]
GALLASSAWAQTATHEQTAAQVRAAVEGYAKLVDELKFDHLPDKTKDYQATNERLDDLGAQLEGLSRLAQRDSLTDEQWQDLDKRTAIFLTALQYLRCQSLPLRVWAYFDSHDYRKPQWGLAVDKTMAPLTRLKGTFDATATQEIELAARPGETRHAQLVLVPLAADLRSVSLSRPQLKGSAGTIKPEQIRCEPVAYDRLPETPPAVGDEWWRGRLALGKVTVPRDMTQAYILTVSIPPEVKPGLYRGEITFKPEGVQALAAQLTVEVTTDK